jgi:hypothetical protein
MYSWPRSPLKFASCKPSRISIHNNRRARTLKALRECRLRVSMNLTSQYTAAVTSRLARAMCTPYENQMGSTIHELAVSHVDLLQFLEVRLNWP